MGSEIRISLNTEALGRISAQTAKQVILQKVREAERETVYAEFADRVGDLVNCSIKRVEGPDLVVDIGKTEARLPKKEQSRAENFSVSDRVRCVIKSVEKAGKNAGVIVSRAAPDLVMRLFEQEVPEIYDGTVVIRGCAREAGERTKIAVASRDRDVDSVGACVGMKGMRVQSIIRELRGEKIDIIQFSEDPVVFATNALSPAKITRVAIVDPEQRHMEVIVDDSQLSLAIGKKGQNVRLGAKLLGWHIDIKSEEEKRQEVESEMDSFVVPGAPVSVLLDHGLSDGLLGKLSEAGISTVEQLGSMTPEQLEEIPGIGPKMVERLQSSVVGYYSQFETALPGDEAEAGTALESETAAPADGSGLPAETEMPEVVLEAAPEGDSTVPVDETASDAETVAEEAPAEETESAAASGEVGPAEGRDADTEASGETEESKAEVVVAAEGDEPPETGAEALETNVESGSDTELKTTESDTI